MLKKSVLWAFVAGLLLITLVACQNEPTLDPESSLPSVVSEDSVTSIETSPSSQMESLVEEVPSGDASSREPSSQSPAIPSEEPERPSVTPSIPVESLYVYSNKVAEQMQKVNPENPPEVIYVFLTHAASDANKEYDSSYFSGIDVTVIAQNRQGGTPVYDVITSERIDNPLEIMLSLKVNTAGWENFQKVVMALDGRDDISLISLEPIGVYAN